MDQFERQRREYLTKCHTDAPEIVTQYGHYRIRVTFDPRGVILSAFDNEEIEIGTTLIAQADFAKMRTPLSVNWAYDRALVYLERCALEHEGFFTQKDTA